MDLHRKVPTPYLSDSHARYLWLCDCVQFLF